MPSNDTLPSSPPLPPTRPALTRKRTYASQLSASCASSDPAFFSSDDLHDADVDHYNNVRPRKRVQWKGTWWGDRETDEDNISARTRAATRKRTFTRNIDSGIYMGSDDSEATAPDNELVLPNSNVVIAEPIATKRQRSVMEDTIAKRIMDTMERHSSRVNLSGLQLESLDGQVSIICIRHYIGA